MKHTIIVVLSVLLLLSTVPSFFADDQEFFSYYVTPEVWIILDTSGSMRSNFGGHSRLYVAKDAIYQVVNDPDIDIRWGFTTFYQEYVKYWWGGRWYGSNWAGTQHTPKYAYKAFFIRVPMGEPDSAHIAQISAWIDHDWTPDSLELEANGYTPLPNVLRGAYVRIRKDALADTTGARWCRRFYVLLVTDGYPTHGIDPVTYYDDTLALWDAFAPNKLAQTCEEADSLRKLRVPANGGNPAQTIEVKTYVIGVGPGIGNLNQVAQHGGTDHYYPATDPAQLQEAFEQILSEITSEATSYSGAEVTSIQEEFITQNYQAKMYLCSFIPANDAIWDGHMKSVKLIPGVFNVDSIPDSLVYWDAGDTLANTPSVNRTIYTEKNYARVPFDAANITAADLGVATASARDSVINTVYSGSPTGTKGYLSDIFHSTPLRIHGPNYFYEDDDFYKYRMNQDTTRPSMIYAGGNDGMLHCFDDSTGEEMWAFIPKDQLPNLKYLLTEHRYFEDANTMAADVWFPNVAGTDSFKNEDEWRTVLIIGQRQGGRNYSALDVTYPSNPFNPYFLFNFDTTMANLGETWSDANIYKVHKNTLKRKDDRSLAFFGGGYWQDTLYDIYNPPDSVPGSGIYALDVYNMCGKPNPVMGTDYWKIPAASGYADSMLYPFPSEPSIIDTNLDTYGDMLYIGDVAGQLWKVILNGDSSAVIIDNWRAQPIFRAPKPNNPANDYLWQPIFFPVSFAWDGRRWWLFFGTGDRANAAKEGTVNRFYGIIDGNYSIPLTEDTLKRISVDGPLTETEIQSDRYKGWYIVFTDFNGADSIGARDGEKVTSYATVLMDTLIFTTFQPYELNDPCVSAGGIARQYKMYYKTGNYNGTAPSHIIGAGIPQAPRFSYGISGEGFQIISLPGQVIVQQMPPIGIRRKLLWWHETH